MIKSHVPKVGDFLVSYLERDGFAIERRASENRWGRIAFEKDRLAALQRARTLAREAGTKAWTYELDNQFIEISLG